MRILAFSDLHLSRTRAEALVEASRGVDLVIGAGDFCNARAGLDQAMAMLSGLAAPLLAVPGNAESAEELRAAAPEATVLHGEGAVIGGVRFFGLGGGVPVTPFGAWSFDLTEAAAEELLAACEAADVLVTHSPPKGVADATSAGLSVGSTAIRAAIERLQPALALCGHVHEAWRQEGRIGRTRVVNLGPFAHVFEVSPEAGGQ
ncbi:Predicted phosphoesterase [Meinhardsimonia xiamenensis]|jgi:Icc-related predicted phosphoesterase|uniref:Predicted phosphoesterase n=1 Tax=Meinhardsimonia xiamenensis TaxID=990712 RepID=A0A1G9ABU0_9RHOB|nr:metallophosphoesterase family protein [Meinhardsimonia xiamenensis]PRX35449.1 Icc-related predicted phosphoesterase [Meinhardsimonia xiamenensis]SDK24837.1 Predicted phosphoesterase [Meinhardsimonia xiamenensis]